MLYSDIIINLINSFKKNDNQEIDFYITKLIEITENQKQYKLAKKLREVYASHSDNYHSPNLFHSSSTSSSNEQNQKLFEIRKSKINISNIVLSETNLKILLEIIENYKKREILRSHGLSNDSRVILYGPPGTGKTLFAYVLAGELGIPIYHVFLDSLISSYLGETGKNLKAIFKEASSNNCVLLLDEFDAIAKQRDDSQELGELKRVVTVLLQNIDDLNPNTVLIAATNHDHLLDSAVWRRFDYSLRMDSLEPPLRKALIKMYLTGDDNININLLAEISEGLSGAIIKQVINRSLRKILLNKDTANLETTLIENFLSVNTEKIDSLKEAKRKSFIRAIQYLRKINKSKYTYENLERITGIPSSTIHYINK